MENKYDPRGALRAMREISTMFALHVKSAVTMRMRKKDGTTATTDEENGQVLYNNQPPYHQSACLLIKHRCTELGDWTIYM